MPCHPPLALTRAPHKSGCEDRDLVMSFWFLLCPLSWLSILVKAMWWLLWLSPSWRGSPLRLFAFGSFKEHEHHLPGVCQMQVSSCLLCTTCPLQKDVWKKTTEKWTESASCHPPMVSSEVTALWACLNEKWFLSWHLGMWKANKCSHCFSASW